MNDIEIWKDIKGYEGLYQVSSLGRIKSLERYKKNHSKLQKVEEKEMKTYISKHNGYVYIALFKNSKEKNIRVHRIVAEAFIPNTCNKTQINHIDGNKTNNRVDNLEWCTCSENINHAYKTGLSKNKQKIRIKQFDQNYNLINEFKSLIEASQKTKIPISSISFCINGKRKQANGYIFERGG